MNNTKVYDQIHFPGIKINKKIRNPTQSIIRKLSEDPKNDQLAIELGKVYHECLFTINFIEDKLIRDIEYKTYILQKQKEKNSHLLLIL